MTIQTLIDGYKRFKATRFEQQRALYEELNKRGQSPKVLFIACCDSRCDPATITDAGPGEIFVVRNVANLVPPYSPQGTHHGTSAAIEFAVLHLGVEHIVVMGHAQCGGARALLMGADRDRDSTSFIGSWMALASRARDEVVAASPRACHGDEQRRMEHAIVRLSLANLRSFPWVRERLEDGRLGLYGWYFGIADGVLYALDQGSGEFRPLVED